MVGKSIVPFTMTDMMPLDVPDVLSIERVSFTTPWSATLFMNEIYKPLSIAMVARSGEDIVGYICADQVLDEGHILNVTVHPECRRRGMAAHMLAHVTGLLARRACKSIFLEVRISNRAALGMYEKSGFSMISVRKRYYTSPEEDAVIMKLQIPS